MSRIIKFRVWNKIAEQWAENSHFLLFKDNDYCFADDGQFIFQQYTGLKGFGNVEIYEGDVVEYGMVGLGRPQGAVPYKENSAYWTKKEIVKWSSHGYGSIVTYAHCIQNKNQGNDYRARVIGNIFENPELIKKIEENNKNYPAENFFTFNK